MYNTLLTQAIKLERNHRGDIFAAFFVQILLRLIALVPLAAIFTPHKQLACLCPLLWVFLVLPLRFSMADGLNRFVAGEKLFSYRIISFSQYFSKLLKALGQLIKMLLSGALIISAMVYVVDLSTKVDPFTFIRMLQQLGGGKFETGLVVAAAIACALCIPIIMMMGFCCGDRFIFAKGIKPYSGMRRGYFKVGLLSFLLLLPAIACVVGAFFTSMPLFIYTLGRDTSGFKTALYLLIAAILLYVPSLPIRKLLVPIAVNHEA